MNIIFDCFLLGGFFALGFFVMHELLRTVKYAITLHYSKKRVIKACEDLCKAVDSCTQEIKAAQKTTKKKK